MTHTNSIGDPPAQLPHAISPSLIRRRVLRAELEEIQASREHRGLSADAVAEIQAALAEDEKARPEMVRSKTWRARLWDLLERPDQAKTHNANSATETRDPRVSGHSGTWVIRTLRSALACEQEDSTERRQWHDTPIRPPEVGLVGLALSGGGIRSATVCLGVLQELATKNVLHLVDYLSTVSGGGYIGSCWSGLLARSSEYRELVRSPGFPFIHKPGPEGRVVEPWRQQQSKEPIALVHVRDFANYLTPRGLRDQIRIPALLLRGLIINFLVILPAILLLSAVTLWAYGDAIAEAMRSARNEASFEDVLSNLPGFATTKWLAVICVAYLLLATGVQTLRSWSWPRKAIDATVGWPDQNGWRARRNLLAFGASLLLALVAVAAFEATQYPVTLLAHSEQGDGRLARSWPGGVMEPVDLAEDEHDGREAIPVAPAAGPDQEAKDPRSWRSLLASTEFWSALGAVAGVVSALVAGQAAGSPSSRTRRIAFAAVGILAPIGLLIFYFWTASFLSVFALYDYGLLERVFGTDQFWRFYLGDPDVWGAIYVGVALILWLLLTLIVDINRTSLHNYYRDRLSRAFMFRLEPVEAAATPAADAKRSLWRTQHEDEIPLTALRPKTTGGPYHLINAIVNSPDFSEDHRAGTETQRGRRADFFVFSPRYCGNERLGYCQTRKLEHKDPHMNLATAMAISAAAAAPNMGQKTFSPLLVFLMSMLNVRLGYWMRKPESVEEPDRFRWPVGPLYFLRELLGLPPRKSAYINLSDGGHLDNTGIFELLRRRCRYIIAVDAEADPQLRFNGLATLQRLARIDLGVEVHFDVEDLRRNADGLSCRHFALCKIDYGDGRTGKLLYIKSSMTGTEIEYIKEYWRRNPTFPHETTGDQFFDEAQFEAYRALGAKMGYEVVERVKEPDVASGAAFFGHLENWLQPVTPLENGLADLVNRRRSIDERLRTDGFTDYRNEIWPPYNGEHAPEMQESHARFDHEGKTLWDAGETPKPHILQLVNEQIQLMEMALLQLRLDDRTNWGHPRNRGWREMFGRWSRSATFRKYWQLSIPYYSHGLEAFGVSMLKLPQPLHQRPEAA